MEKASPPAGIFFRRFVASAVVAACSMVALPMLPAAGANINTTFTGFPGDWFDPTKWTAGVPSNDGVNFYKPLINTGTVTLSQNVTTSGLSMGTVFLSSPGLIISSGNTYNVVQSFAGNSSISGNITLNAGAFLDVTDNMTFGNGAITGGGTYRQLARTLTLAGGLGGMTVSNFVVDGGAVLNGAGTMTITNHADFLNFSVNVFSGKIIEGTTASMTFTSPATASALSGNFSLLGTTTFTSPTSYTIGNSPSNFSNSGTLSLASTGGGFTTLTLSSLINTGTISLQSGIIDISTFNTSTGTLGGYITADVGSSIRTSTNVQLQNLTMVGGGFLNASGGATFVGSNIIQNASFGSLSTINSGTIHVTNFATWGSIFSGSGQQFFADPGATVVISTLSVTTPGTITNNGNMFIGVDTAGSFIGGGLSLASNARLINNGQITLAGNLSNSGTAINNGVIRGSETNATGQFTITTPLINTGTLSGPYSLAVGSSATSSGMLSPDAGPLPRTLSISGPITLQNGSVLTSAHNGLIFVGSLYTVTLTGKTTADHFSFWSLTGSGSLTLLDVNTWNGGVLGSGLSGPTVIVSQSASLAMFAPATLSPGTITNNGTIYMGFAPPSRFGTGTFTVDLFGGLINNGTLYLEATIAGSGTITNNGLITPYTTSFGQHVINTGLINNGTLSGTVTLGGRLLNSGTVTGPVTINGGGSSSGLLSGDSFLGPRTLTIGSTGFTLGLGASVSSAAGTVNANGLLTIGTASIPVDHLIFNSVTNAGTLDLLGPNVWASGTITGIPGGQLVHVETGSTLSLGTLSNSTPLQLTNIYFLNEGTTTIPFPNNAFFYLSNSTLDNRGTFTMPLHGINTIGPTSVFLNSGNLIIPASASTLTISSPIYNTGTITLSTSGTLTVNPSSTFFDGGSASGTIIASTPTSVVAFTNSLKPYTLSNATLSGPGLFTGSVTLLGANAASNVGFTSITGPGSLDVSGTMTLPAGSPGAFRNTQITLLPSATLNSFPFSAPSLNNVAFINQAASASMYGTMSWSNGASFLNQGSFTIQANQFLTINLSTPHTASQFTNAGLLNVNGAFTLTNAPFINTGSISIGNNGTLSLTYGGTLSGLISITGLGLLSAPTINGKTMTLDGAAFQGSTPGGVFILAHTNTAENFGVGTLVGPGSLSITKALGLASPTSAPLITGGATVRVLPGGSLVLGSQSVPYLTPIVDNATLINQGAIVIPTNLASTNALLKLANGGAFINNGTLSYSPPFLNVPLKFDSDGNPNNAFINNGSISFAINSGTITFNTTFYNTGTYVTTPQGSFSTFATTFAGGGSSSGLISANSIIPITFAAPYTFDNATVSNAIFGSTITLLHANVGFSVGISANLSGPGTLTGGNFDWRSGTITNAGGVIANLTESQVSSLFRSWSGAPVSASIALDPIVGNASKVIDATTLQIAPGVAAAWAFSNTAVKVADELTLKNGAQVINDGTFYSYLPKVTISAADNHSANAFINHGTFGRSAFPNTFGLGALTTIAVPFHNTGTVDIQQGFIDFKGGYFNDSPITFNTALFAFAPNTGLYFSGGTYDFGDRPIDLGNGGLYGTGDVQGNFISSGTISPGNSPGTLTIDGDLTLTSASTLALEVSYAGTAPQFDALILHGHFTAGGMLQITLLTGTPDNSVFNFVLADAFSGQFDNAPDGSRLLDTTGSASYLISYSPSGITLSDPQPVPEPLSLGLLAPALLAFSLRRRGRRPIHCASRPPRA